jgi:hypothetical protein
VLCHRGFDRADNRRKAVLGLGIRGVGPELCNEARESLAVGYRREVPGADVRAEASTCTHALTLLLSEVASSSRLLRFGYANSTGSAYLIDCVYSQLGNQGQDSLLQVKKTLKGSPRKTNSFAGFHENFFSLEKTAVPKLNADVQRFFAL